MEQPIPPAPSSIEKWYRGRCNGDWEHPWGMRIETVDTSEWVKINRSIDDWLMYRAVGDKFEAACGPLNPEALQVFASWYDSPW